MQSDKLSAPSNTLNSLLSRSSASASSQNSETEAHSRKRSAEALAEGDRFEPRRRSEDQGALPNTFPKPNNTSLKRRAEQRTEETLTAVFKAMKLEHTHPPKKHFIHPNNRSEFHRQIDESPNKALERLESNEVIDLDTPDSLGILPIHTALASNHALGKTLAQTMLKRNPDLDLISCNMAGFNAIDYAQKEDHHDLFWVMLMKPDVNLHTPNQFGKTTFQRMVQDNPTVVPKVLSMFKFKSRMPGIKTLNHQDHEGYSTVHLALKSPQPELALHLLDMFPQLNLNTLSAQSNRSPFHDAVESYPVIAKQLLKKTNTHLDVNTRDNQGRSPLTDAQDDEVKALIQEKLKTNKSTK